MVWKSNFDRVFDDRVLLPMPTDHKRANNDYCAIPSQRTRSLQHKDPVVESYAKSTNKDSVKTKQDPEIVGNNHLDEILNKEDIPGVIDAADTPELVSSTLQHIVGEMNVMSQTLGLLVQRLTLNEDRVKKLDEQMKLQNGKIENNSDVKDNSV